MKIKKVGNDHAMDKNSSQITADLSGNLRFSGKQPSKLLPHV